MAKYVAVSPETGNEYEVTSREELVNLLSRGYTEKVEKTTPKTMTPVGVRQSADEVNVKDPRTA